MSSYRSIDLEAHRGQRTPLRQPFPHQKEAFQALDRTFALEKPAPKAALLVLPTGAGKTFTAVNWACRKAIPRGMRVLWLAQSFHLLDQAVESFEDNARQIPPPARFLNLRAVSSHPDHDKVSAIAQTDDVLVVTTQTAISAVLKESTGLTGDRFVSNLEKFIVGARKSGLVVVLDEAHHAPAYGCRTLLARVRELVPNMALLGLTATPTYTDEAMRGWLGKIFSEGVAYEAKKPSLMAQNILAKPVYIEMPTGLELEVDNALYRRLVEEHKDLPEELIEKLARNSARNDYIINHYVQNRTAYGKTLIFADRWFQCVYIKEKLKEKKIRAAAVFSHVDAGSEGMRASSTTAENAENIRKFKAGELDVLVNVRMLTEGTDVPDTRTVFVTRQTTSSILLTQMVGRALRGKRAGGGEDKEQANVVLFVDQWKHLLDVFPLPEGGTGQGRVQQGHKPLEYIAIHLVEQLCRRIENPDAIDPRPYMSHVPVGWYQAEYSVAINDEGKETTELVREFVMIFEHSRDRYARFVESVFPELPKEWGKELLEATWTEPQVQRWRGVYFDGVEDPGNSIERNLTSLARHMGASGCRPEFIPFEARDQYDLDALADRLYDQPSPAQLSNLRAEFDKEGNLWRVFYKSNFEWFKMDFDAAVYRLWKRRTEGVTVPERPSKPTQPTAILDREQWARLRDQVLERDNWTCQACAASGKGIKLHLDHIVSKDHGGADTIDNLQTLCSVCNGGRYKGVNDLNFRSHVTPLKSPKQPVFLDANPGEDAERSLRRLVNFFYHCGAVCRVKMNSRRNGKNYTTWEVELYSSNDPDWLMAHKPALLEHISSRFGCDHVTDIVIR